MKCIPFGAEALLVDLDVATSPERARRTRAVASALRAALGAGADVVVGAGTVLVTDRGIDRAEVEAVARRALCAPLEPEAPARRHEVPAVYDGPDLAGVAAHAGLRVEEIVERHTGRDHEVELLGFLPGFAYLGPVNPALVVPRRASPRPRVEAGSIAVAGGFSGIYPFASPGGWHLIARTAFVAFDALRPEPSAFRPGDLVRFVACRADEVATVAKADVGGSSVGPPRRPALLVEAAVAGCSIQDRGRSGRLGEGLPPSGPLVPELLDAANAAVGNPPDAAAIEVPLGSLRLRALCDVVVSTDGAPAMRLPKDATLDVAPATHAVRYVAAAGGIDVPSVLGARATLAAARFGGLEGRWLRAGDRLGVSGAEGGTRALATTIATGGDAEVDVDPGPHDAAFGGGAWSCSRRRRGR